jgi:hypothetical protein
VAGSDQCGRAPYWWLRLNLFPRSNDDYNPTADAVFSLNSDPSRMYRRSTVMLLWPIV